MQYTKEFLLARKREVLEADPHHDMSADVFVARNVPD
jgi:hypothetical protein